MQIAYASVGLPMMFFLWMFLELNHGDLKPILEPPYEYLIVGICGLCVAVLIWMATRIFKSGLSLAWEEPELKEKLIIYEKVSARKFIYLLIASLVTLTGLYICANEIFGLIYAVIIVIFSLGNPTGEKISQDLRLNQQNKKTILKNEDFHFQY